MSFAHNLKFLRTKNDMTQKDVAKLLNVTRTTIAGYESGRRQPSHEMLIALSQLFQVSIDYLINDLDTTPLSSDESALLELYRSLPGHSKKELITYCHLLAFHTKQKGTICVSDCPPLDS